MQPYWSVGITNPLLAFNFVNMARDKANVEIYCPKYIKKQYIKKMDKYKDVERPAYGGYIFVRIENDKSIYQLMRITIACTILKINGEYVSVRDTEIDRLKLMELNNDMVPLLEDEKVKFVDGKIVTVKHGAFAGKKAIMTDRIKNNDKLIWADVDGKKIKIPLYFFKELEDSRNG